MDQRKLREELERDEGRLLRAYKDSAVPPNWTIGIGHLLGSTPRMSDITDAECNALYEADWKVAQAAMFRLFPETEYWQYGDAIQPEWDVRARAIINMIFNRGEQRMRESTQITPALRGRIEAGSKADWSGIADIISNTPWATQVGKRATRIGYMLEFGKEPQ